MRTALDVPDQSLDAEERRFVGAIREHGFFATHVPADAEGPGFSYSTGFWVGLGRPEIIVFSLNIELAHQVLWDLYRDLKAGKVPPVGERAAGVFGNADAWLRPVDRARYGDFLGWSRWFHGGDDFPCLQLFWPDREGRFGWEAGAEAAFRDLQPDLSAPPGG